MRLFEDYACCICRQREASYYCESCFLTFCSSCTKRKSVNYSACEKCGSAHYFDAKSGPPSVCTMCGHESFRLGVRKLVVCPRCLSENVVDLVRKREEQTARLNAITRSLLSASSLMLNVINSASKAKARLLNLRKKGFLHNPQLEEDVLGVYEALSALKVKALSKAERIMSSAASRAALLIREWSPRSIREIEACFEQVEGALRDYRQLVEEECRCLEERLREISSVLDYLDFHRELFEEREQLLAMEASEKPVCALPHVKYVGSSYLPSNKGTGVLFLTTERVVFLKKEGVLRHSFKKYFSLPLAEVELNVKRGLRGYFTLKTDKGTVRFTAPRQVLENVEAYFTLAKNFQANSQLDRSLTLKLESTAIGLSDFRRAIASLIDSTLKMGEEGARSTATPKQRPPPIARPCPRPINRPASPSTGDQEALMNLEKKKYAVEQNLKRLKELWDEGEIPLEEYLKMSRRLESDLYELNVKIQKLKNG
ncbi:MAG: hypothetical protein QXN15_07625 [Candidatus Jordarchaeales archaeon]|nr:hypothetical protein [Candidatus Jordarchaeia archaeon]